MPPPLPRMPVSFSPPSRPCRASVVSASVVVVLLVSWVVVVLLASLVVECPPVVVSQVVFPVVSLLASQLQHWVLLPDVRLVPPPRLLHVPVYLERPAASSIPVGRPASSRPARPGPLETATPVAVAMAGVEATAVA